jgi:hypothetical protein
MVNAKRPAKKRMSPVLDNDLIYVVMNSCGGRGIKF